MTAGAPIVASRRRFDPRGRRRRRAAGRTGATSTRSAIALGARAHRRGRHVRGSSRAGHEQVGQFAWRTTAERLADALPCAGRRRRADGHLRRCPNDLSAPAAARRARRRRRRRPDAARGPGQCSPTSRSRRSSTRPMTPMLHGLYISPDLDTVTYTLAGAIDPERGWGLAGETVDGDGGPRPVRRPCGRRIRRRHDLVQPR